uniref:AB hydrolase-1 domain-containing protein n=1 Tax=Vannella robusta TaxID=1487602 RepID=A0A7S4HJE6_9EUKA
MRWFLISFVVVLAVITYNRIPEVVDPDVRLCKTLGVFAPQKPSDFMPGVCREIRVSHQDHMMSTVYDCGSEDAGMAVVLLHGFPDNAKTWRRQIDEFVSHGYRVVIPTLRGYETSTQTGSYHITSLATDVLCIAEALDIPQYDVVGHDWGAIVGHTLAITNPSKIRALVSVAVPPQMVKHGAKIISQFPSQLLHSWYMLYFQIPFLPEMTLQHSEFLLRYLITSWSPTHNWQGDKHVQEIIDTFKKPGVATAAVNYYRQNCLAFVVDAISNLLYGGKEYLDISHPIRGKIAVDTLLVTGRADGCILTDIYDADSTNIFQRDVDHRVIRLSGGHYVHYEQPQDFNAQVVRFLTRRPETIKKTEDHALVV